MEHLIQAVFSLTWLTLVIATMNSDKPEGYFKEKLESLQIPSRKEWQ